VNIQPGQAVAIRCLVEHVELARAVTEHAYRAGARRVLVEYLDNHVRRSMVVHAPAETLSTSLPFPSQVFRDLGDAHAAFIQLTGSPEPDLFRGLDASRVTAKDKELTALAQEVILSGAVARTIVAAPNPGWAAQMFGEPDLDSLWDAVAIALRLDEDDLVQAWWPHSALLQSRAAALTACGFDAVHYVGGGADLTVGLDPTASRGLDAVIAELDSDEGARSLGEVSLVEGSSPGTPGQCRPPRHPLRREHRLPRRLGDGVPGIALRVATR
jgi:aminopeptidase